MKSPDSHRTRFAAAWALLYVLTNFLTGLPSRLPKAFQNIRFYALLATGVGLLAFFSIVPWSDSSAVFLLAPIVVGMMPGPNPYFGGPPGYAGPPQSFASPPGSSGPNAIAVAPSGGLGIHPFVSTTGLGAQGRGVVAPAGSLYFFSQLEVATALAAVNLPSKMFLVNVQPECDDGPGTFEIGYLASNNAHFAAPASATDATGLIGVGTGSPHIAVNWACSTVIPAGTFTANGDCFQATLTFSSSPGMGNPDISAYRAMYQTETFTDTTSDAQSVTFDNGPAVPIAFLVMQHALATATSMPMGEIDYSNGAQYKHIIAMQANIIGYPTLVPAQPIAPALSFAFNQVFSTLGASTNVIAALVIFY